MNNAKNDADLMALAEEQMGNVGTPEEAGVPHVPIDFTKFKLNCLVEIISDRGIRLMGVINCNKDGVLRLADPLIVESRQLPATEENRGPQFVISMQPWRVVGDDNFAQFNYDDIANISEVNSPEYIRLWDMNVNELARLWLQSGDPQKYAEIEKRMIAQQQAESEMAKQKEERVQTMEQEQG